MSRLLIVGALGVMVMLGLLLSKLLERSRARVLDRNVPGLRRYLPVNELATGRAHVIPLWRILLRQALHWLGPIIAVQFTYLLSGTPYTPPRPPVSI